MDKSGFVLAHDLDAWKMFVEPLQTSGKTKEIRTNAAATVHHQVFQPLIDRLNQNYGKLFNCISLVVAKRTFIARCSIEADWQILLEEAKTKAFDLLLEPAVA